MHLLSFVYLLLADPAQAQDFGHFLQWKFSSVPIFRGTPTLIPLGKGSPVMRETHMRHIRIGQVL